MATALQKKLEITAKKLERVKGKFMKSGNFSVRDHNGFMQSANRILQGVRNMSYGGWDNLGNPAYSIEAAIPAGVNINFSNVNGKNFSANDVNHAGDMDVANIAIAGTLSSWALTFISAERSMDALTKNVTFQGLTAINTAGGFNAGDTAYDPRHSISPFVNLGRSSAERTFSDTAVNGDSVSSGKPILQGLTKIYTNYGTPTQTLVGFTQAANEQASRTNIDPIFFVKDMGFTDGLSIDLSNGSLIFTAGKVTNALTFLICIDRGQEQDGATTLKVKPRIINTLLTAQRNGLILENNVIDMAQMNKVYQENAEAGLAMDFGSTAVNQILKLYTSYLNFSVIDQLWQMVRGFVPAAFLDLSSYSMQDFKSFAGTKNDLLNHFMRSLSTFFKKATNQPITAWVVDNDAYLMLQCDGDNFKDSEMGRAIADGFVGTYGNVPVILSRYLDGKAGTLQSGATGLVIGVFKSLSGEAAPVVFGDYLPPFSVQPTLNVNNPQLMASALYSMTATGSVAPEWAIVGVLKSY